MNSETALSSATITIPSEETELEYGSESDALLQAVSESGPVTNATEVQLIAEPLVTENEPIAPIVSTVGLVKLNLSQQEGRFLSPEMPRDIEGLVGVKQIASQVFSSRIQQLNDSLKEFKDCKDRGPLMRLLTLILVFSVNLAVQLLSDSLMCILVTFCISLVFMVIVSEAAMARHKFEKEITTQLIGFNQEDEAIRLVWRLVPYGNLVFISLRPIPFARLIQIQHVMKGGANEEEEYLPAYSRLAASLEGGLAELPSYDTLA